jgi:CDGSH-type Zn-finger protein
MTSENQRQTSPRIKVTKDGPYHVQGAVPLQSKIILTDEEGTPIKWEPSTKYPTTQSCLICRCGRSKNKPYCDSSHIEVGFDGTETADHEEYLEKPDIIDGPSLRLIDYKELCASARFCHRAGGIWKLVPESDNLQKRKIACEESADCPSGRLVIEEKKTRTIVEPNLSQSIIFIEDPAIGTSGPIWVCGSIPVESAKGKPYQIRNRVTLCRCGKSLNKPFCDSSHYPEEHEPHGENKS